MSRLPIEWPLSEPLSPAKRCWNRSVIDFSASARATRQLRISPGGIIALSRISRPLEPPSSVTVTTAVMFEVWAFRPRRSVESPVPPPIATMRGPCASCCRRRYTSTLSPFSPGLSVSRTWTNADRAAPTTSTTPSTRNTPAREPHRVVHLLRRNPLPHPVRDPVRPLQRRQDNRSEAQPHPHRQHQHRQDQHQHRPDERPRRGEEPAQARGGGSSRVSPRRRAGTPRAHR